MPSLTRNYSCHDRHIVDQSIVGDDTWEKTGSDFVYCFSFFCHVKTTDTIVGNCAPYHFDSIFLLGYSLVLRSVFRRLMNKISRLKALCNQKDKNDKTYVVLYQCFLSAFRGSVVGKVFWWVGVDVLRHQDLALSYGTWFPVIVMSETFSTIFAEIFQFGGWSPSQFGPHFVLIASFWCLRCPLDVRGEYRHWFARVSWVNCKCRSSKTRIFSSLLDFFDEFLVWFF